MTAFLESTRTEAGWMARHIIREENFTVHDICIVTEFPNDNGTLCSDISICVSNRVFDTVMRRVLTLDIPYIIALTRSARYTHLPITYYNHPRDKPESTPSRLLLAVIAIIDEMIEILGS